MTDEPDTAGDDAPATTSRRDAAASAPTHRWRRRLVVVLGVVLAAALVDVGVLWARTDRIEADLPGSGGRGTTWLLIGSDDRSDVPAGERDRFGSTGDVPGARADILVALRVGDGRPRVLGIPRDLVVFRPRSGPERLAPMLDDGPGAIASALCNSLGLGVDHVGVIRFDGLVELTDLAGGITVQSDAIAVDRNSGLLLDRGTNRLDGSRALAYVRARHIETYDGSTWTFDPALSGERSARAMQVIGGIAGGLDLSWTSPLDAQRAAWAVTGAVSVDSGAGPFDALDLMEAMRGLRHRDERTLQVRDRGQSVPMADLTSVAAGQLKWFLGGHRSSKCDRPVLPGLGA